MRLRSVNTPSFGYLDLFGEVKENCSKTDAILLLLFFLSHTVIKSQCQQLPSLLSMLF